MIYKFLAIASGLMFLFMLSCDKKNSTEPEMKTRFKVTIENISMPKMFPASGVFNTPVGSNSPAPIGPGQAYEFSFHAAPGSRLSFATMFVHSNDLFYAPDEAGIPLFDNNNMPVSGDVTAQIKLWDAGTEINQEPGVGEDQPPRQAAPNNGSADPNNTVREATNDFANLPAVNEVIKVTITSTSATGFTVRIENVSQASTLTTSTGMSLSVPLAPGVWVVHTTDEPLFTRGAPDRQQGLEALAEDGNPSVLAAALTAETGITQLLAPGVFAIHTTSDPLFTAGEMDRGQGLEALAEDGDPGTLVGNLKNQSGISYVGVFNTPAGSSMPGPLPPGARYEFEFEASSGAYLSFATMLVQSNDLFFAPAAMGIPLYNSDGSAVTGNVTNQIMLWDAGTEVNELPGIGLNQPPRQAAPNTGTTENGTVRLVNDMFSYPDVSDVIRVTIERR